MALQFPGEWVFDESLGHMPEAAIDELLEFVNKIAARTERGNLKSIYETFKEHFGHRIPSSSIDFAKKDMISAMKAPEHNIPSFIEAFWNAMMEISKGHKVPSSAQINAVLTSHEIDYSIDSQKLIRKSQEKASKQSAGTPGAFASYTRGKLLGAGGYGEVFEAIRRTTFGTFDYAIKVHHPSAFTEKPERARQRFIREANALRGLQHRAIVSHLDAGLTDDGRPFLVMPLIKGKNIRDATTGNPTLAIKLMLEVLGAVAYAHDNRVLHRDLKPANILVRDSDQQPIIVDFGLSYFFDDASQESLTTAGMGTPGYIPHEVIMSPKERSPLHDIYSCGIIMYELLSGKLPDPSDYRVLAETDARLAPLDSVIKQAIAPADRRFESARNFATATAQATRSLLRDSI